MTRSSMADAAGRSCADEWTGWSGHGARVKSVTPGITLIGLEPDLVNTITPGLQTDQVIAALADGGYVVAWASYDTFSRRIISTQRYDAMGEEVGGQTLVETTATGNATGALPVVAGLRDGGYVLAYEFVDARSTTMTSAVFAQRFDSGGERVDGMTVISVSFQYTDREFEIVRTPSVAPLDDGGFVIGWVSEQTLASPPGTTVVTTVMQRYDSAGAPLGAPTSFSGRTSIQVLGDGGFAVGDTLFDGSAAVVGTSGADLADTSWSATEALGGGGYVVVSLSTDHLLHQQFLDGGGNASGARAAIGAGGPESLPEVVALSDGGYVVLWLARPAAASPLELQAQRFDGTGAALGDTLHIDAPEGYVAGPSQKPPAVAALADGGFAVSWLVVGPAGPDLYTQLFAEARVGTDAADRLAGTTGDDVLHGLAGADRIEGRAGDDTINGGEGRDRMAGGTGDDTYFVDHRRDQVVERDGEGHDRVYSSVSHELDRHVEDLVLTGPDPIDGRGNALDNLVAGTPAANRLEGGAGDDTLEGLAGNDVLVGGAGVDTLDGGAGADVIVLDERPAIGNIDVLVSFSAYEDSIRLDPSVFRRIHPTGTLGADAFQVGASALDASDRIIHDPATGALMYDPDGTGRAAPVQIATFVGLVGVLSADDFIVVD